MFALALISASLVPGTTGMKPGLQAEPEEKVSNLEAPLVENEEWENRWKLIKTGLWNSTVGKCGEVNLGRVSNWSGFLSGRQSRRFLPLGCALKSKKSSGDKMTNIEERWFMFEVMESVSEAGTTIWTPTIHYYKPMKGLPKGAKSLPQPQNSVIITQCKPISKTVLGPQDGYAYHYTTLEYQVFTVGKNKTLEQKSLRLIFRNNADAEAFSCILEACWTAGMMTPAKKEPRKPQMEAEATAPASPSDASADSALTAEKPEPTNKTQQPLSVGVVAAIKEMYDNGATKAALEKLRKNPEYTAHMGDAIVSKGGVAGDCAQDKPSDI